MADTYLCHENCTAAGSLIDDDIPNVAIKFHISIQISVNFSVFYPRRY